MVAKVAAKYDSKEHPDPNGWSDNWCELRLDAGVSIIGANKNANALRKFNVDDYVEITLRTVKRTL